MMLFKKKHKEHHEPSRNSSHELKHAEDKPNETDHQEKSNHNNQKPKLSHSQHDNEQTKRLEEEIKKLETEKKIEEEKRKAEEKLRLDEEMKWKEEETKRLLEEERRQEEKKRKKEEKERARREELEKQEQQRHEKLTHLQGFLNKKGHVRKNWKTRFFIIKGCDCHYYTDVNQNNMKGSFCLAGCSVLTLSDTDGKKYCFMVKCVKEGKTYLLSAGSDDEKQNWIEAFEYISDLDVSLLPKSAGH